MHAAKLARSARLQRVLSLLIAEQSRWISTRSIIRKARVCAVNSIIAELRENGCGIESKQEVGREGQRRWLYRLIKAPEGWEDEAA